MVKVSRDFEKTSMVSMHPALDFVGGVAYVAVNTVDEGGQIITAVLSSEGGIWSMEEWIIEARKRGFAPKVKEINLPESRWKQESIAELEDGKLTASSFKEAYDAIYKALDERLVLLDPRYITVLTLHAMMTYFHPLFKKLPILHPLGPSESGKSSAGILYSKVAFNGHTYSDYTPSSLFRMAHERRETQVLTESDDLAQMNSGDRFIKQLQGGTTKEEAMLTLTGTQSNKTFKPETYYTFNPKVLVSTKEIKAPTLRNRCITLYITKTPNADPEKLRRAEEDTEELWEDLRDNMYRLLLVRHAEVEQSRLKTLKEWKGPRGRVRDKWLPLASIARLVSKEVLREVHELAMEDQREQQRDERTTFEALIFRFARYIVKDGDKKLTAGEMFDEFLKLGIPNRPSQFGPTQQEINEEPPLWATKLGLTISHKKLREWVRDRDGLVRELSNRNLAPREKEKTRTNKGFPYKLDKSHIDALVAAYIGTEEEDDEDKKGEDGAA